MKEGLKQVRQYQKYINITIKKIQESYNEIIDKNKKVEKKYERINKMYEKVCNKIKNTSNSIKSIVIDRNKKSEYKNDTKQNKSSKNNNIKGTYKKFIIRYEIKRKE